METLKYFFIIVIMNIFVAKVYPPQTFSNDVLPFGYISTILNLSEIIILILCNATFKKLNCTKNEYYINQLTKIKNYCCKNVYFYSNVGPTIWPQSNSFWSYC